LGLAARIPISFSYPFVLAVPPALSGTTIVGFGNWLVAVQSALPLAAEVANRIKQQSTSTFRFLARPLVAVGGEALLMGPKDIGLSVIGSVSKYGASDGHRLDIKV